MKVNKLKKYLFLWPFILGILINYIIIIISKNEMNYIEQTFVNNHLNDENILLNSNNYIFFILKIRIGQILLIHIAKIFKKENLMIAIILFATGSGVTIGVICYYKLYNIIGALLFLLSILLQYFFYIIAIEKYIKIDSSGLTCLVNKREKMGYIVKKLKIFIVVIMGFMAEYYVNLLFWKIFQKLFT